MYPKLIGEEGIFVDIGANVGVNSIFAQLLFPRSRVFAVEPSEVNFDLLTRNKELARCDQLTLVNTAIGSKDGTIGFSGSGTNAHLELDLVSAPEQVACITLDTLFRQLQLPAINLLKIDVEGYTDEVLAKSNKTLIATEFVIIEFSWGDSLLRTSEQVSLTEEERVYENSKAIINKLTDANFAYFYYISKKTA